MEKIQFKTKYKGKQVDVEITAPFGAGGLFHIMIDHYYYGQVGKRGGEWVVLPTKEDSFTEEQKQSILTRLKRAGMIETK